MDAVLALRDLVRAKAGRVKGQSYRVPAFLLGHAGSTHLLDAGDPYLFYMDVCDRILRAAVERAAQPSAVELGEQDVVYLSFIRSFAALDCRIGSALSQLAFLPFIRGTLGATVFVSLPTGAIGRANRLGVRGSPFALGDPFATEPSLGDPLIPEMSAQEQYRALTQACRLLGMRVGSVVPMATLSIDSPLFRDRPDLGFWWTADPGEPLSTMPCDVTAPVATPRYLPHDPMVTRDRFSEPPKPPVGQRHRGAGETFFVGHVNGRAVTLANAFTDVAPADSENAVWPDVAMLNYTSLPYPYFAGASTESIFDPSRPAYALMERVLEWRHTTFGESVFLVDLSANVPAALLDGARSRIAAQGGTVTFIGEELWSFDAQTDGLDAVVGPLPYCVSAHTHNRAVLVQSLRHHLQELQLRHGENPYLAGVANHDTMPVLPEFAALLCACYAFLPSAVTLIFSGSEWHSQMVTNPEFGLGTTPALRAQRRTLGPHVRALFNDVPLAWSDLPKRASDGQATAYLPELYEQFARVRGRLGVDGSWTYAFWTPEARGTDCFGYVRESEEAERRIAVVVNWGKHTVRLREAKPALLRLEISPSGARAFTRVGVDVKVLPNRALVLVSGERTAEWEARRFEDGVVSR
jgi:hypothetical protein